MKPGFFQNEVLAELPFEGRLLFAGLWTLADRDGRLEDRPKRIKAALFPWDALDIDDLLAGLAERGFITRYQTEAVAVIQIVKFHEHQTPHVREAQSLLPSPSLGSAQASPRSPVSISVSDPVSVSKNVSSAPPSAASEPAVMEFPTVGKVKAWSLTKAHVVRWQADYPNLDVFAECRQARAWVLADLGRRKTAGGMERFLVGWFGRSVNRRGAEADRRQTTDRRQRIGYVPPENPFTGWEAECKQLHDSACSHYRTHEMKMALARGAERESA